MRRFVNLLVLVVVMVMALPTMAARRLSNTDQVIGEGNDLLQKVLAELKQTNKLLTSLVKKTTKKPDSDDGDVELKEPASQG